MNQDDAAGRHINESFCWSLPVTRCYNSFIMRALLRSSTMATLIVLFAIMGSLLGRSGLVIFQVAHVAGEVRTTLPSHADHATQAIHRSSAGHEHAHEDSALSHTLHAFLHLLDVLESHPPYQSAAVMHSPRPDEPVDRWHHHLPDPPVYALFRPPRPVLRA